MFTNKIDLLLGMSLVVGGLGTAAIPWCPALLWMSLAFGVQGMAHASLTAGTMVA